MMWHGYADDQSCDDGQWHFIHTPERSARQWLLVREAPFVYQRFTTLNEAISYSQQHPLTHVSEPTA